MDKAILNSITERSEVVMNYRYVTSNGFGDNSNGIMFALSIHNPCDPCHNTIVVVTFTTLKEIYARLCKLKNSRYNFKIDGLNVLSDKNVQDVTLSSQLPMEYAENVQVDSPDSLWNLFRAMVATDSAVVVNSQEIRAENLRFSDSTLNITIAYQDELGRFRTAKIYSLSDYVTTCPVTVAVSEAGLLEFAPFEKYLIEKETSVEGRVYLKYDLKQFKFAVANGFTQFWLTIPQIGYVLDKRDSFKTMLDGVMFGDFLMRRIYGQPEFVSEASDYSNSKTEYTETNVIIKHTRDIPSLRNMKQAVRNRPDLYIPAYREYVNRSAAEISALLKARVGEHRGLMFLALGMEMVMKSCEIGYDEHLFIVISQKIKYNMFAYALEIFKYKAYMAKEQYVPNAKDWSGVTSIGNFDIKMIGGF